MACSGARCRMASAFALASARISSASALASLSTARERDSMFSANDLINLPPDPIFLGTSPPEGEIIKSLYQLPGTRVHSVKAGPVVPRLAPGFRPPEGQCCVIAVSYTHL